MSLAPESMGGGAMYKCDGCLDLVKRGAPPYVTACPRDATSTFYLSPVPFGKIDAAIRQAKDRSPGRPGPQLLNRPHRRRGRRGGDPPGSLPAKPNRPLVKAMFTGTVDEAYARHRHLLWKAKLT